MTIQEHGTVSNYVKIFWIIFFEKEQNPEKDLLKKLVSQVTCFEELLNRSQGYFLIESVLQINRGKRDLIIRKIVQSMGLDEKFILFFNFLIYSKKFFLIFNILKELKDLLLDKLGIEKCNVFSSHKLSKEKEEKLQNHFSKNFGKKLEITFAIKNDLVLGLQVFTKNYVWEVSFSNKLQKIALELKS